MAVQPQANYIILCHVIDTGAKVKNLQDLNWYPKVGQTRVSRVLPNKRRKTTAI